MNADLPRVEELLDDQVAFVDEQNLWIPGIRTFTV